MKDDKNKRKFILHRNHHIGESTHRYYEGKKPVVGISDAKIAIKKNIQTTVSSDSVSNIGGKRYYAGTRMN